MIMTKTLNKLSKAALSRIEQNGTWQVKPTGTENQFRTENLCSVQNTSLKQTKMKDTQDNNYCKKSFEFSPCPFITNTVCNLGNGKGNEHLLSRKLEYLLESGVNLGHKSLKFKSAWHSSLSTFLLGSRNNSAILKNNLTLTYFVRALYILTLIIKAGGNILIINTNPQFSILLQQMRKNTNSSQIFYSDCYWVGGTLTNWAQVSKSINTFIHFYNRFDDFLSKNQINFPRYKKMKKKFKGFIIKKVSPKGEELYTTKVDASETDKKNTVFPEGKQPHSALAKLQTSFRKEPGRASGRARSTSSACLPKVVTFTSRHSVSNLAIASGKQASLVNLALKERGNAQEGKPSTYDALKTTNFDKNWKPDLVFFLNSTGIEAIIKEASILQIPIIALVDSNVNISNITYPIPTNHDSFCFAQFCLNFITKIANKKRM